MSLRSLCRESALHERKATAAASASNLGGHVVTYTTVTAALPVSRPQQKRGTLGVDNGQRRIVTFDVFYSPLYSTVQTGDRLTWQATVYVVQSSRDMGGQNRAGAIYTLRKV